jgi:hypothetical protein
MSCKRQSEQQHMGCSLTRLTCTFSAVTSYISVNTRFTIATATCKRHIDSSQPPRRTCRLRCTHLHRIGALDELVIALESGDVKEARAATHEVLDYTGAAVQESQSVGAFLHCGPVCAASLDVDFLRLVEDAQQFPGRRGEFEGQQWNAEDARTFQKALRVAVRLRRPLRNHSRANPAQMLRGRAPSAHSPSKRRVEEFLCGRSAIALL